MKQDNFEQMSDMMKNFVPVMKPNKNGYEIRTKVLEMAQSQLWQDYHAKWGAWETKVTKEGDEIVTEVGKYANTVFHPVGTCKMGNDETAVVNDRLKAHGLKNLRIVDASIMPHITSGNTNAPTIMIAEKAADMILEDYK